MLRLAAERFGFGEVFNQPIEHYIDACLKGSGITREMLKKGPVCPVEGRTGFLQRWSVTSGKAHFIFWWAKKRISARSDVETGQQVGEEGSPERPPISVDGVQRKLARSVPFSHGYPE